MGRGEEVEEAVVLGMVAAEFFQVGLGIAPLEQDEGRARGLFLRDEGVLRAEPEQGLVLPRFLLVLEAAKQLAQLRVIIVLAGEAEEAVPIDIRDPVAGVELEVRQEAVIRRGVPDQIIGTFFLKVGGRPFRRCVRR